VENRLATLSALQQSSTTLVMGWIGASGVPGVLDFLLTQKVSNSNHAETYGGETS